MICAYCEEPLAKSASGVVLKFKGSWMVTGVHITAFNAGWHLQCSQQDLIYRRYELRRSTADLLRDLQRAGRLGAIHIPALDRAKPITEEHHER